MKGRLIILFVISGLFAVNLNAKEEEGKTPHLKKQDILVLEEAYNLWQEKGDSIWSDWTSFKIPFVYQKNEFEYFIDFPSKPENSIFAGKYFGKNIYARKRKNELSTSQRDVDGVFAVVLACPQIQGIENEEWILTAIHEMFHVYQMMKGSLKKINDLNLAYGEDASWMLEFPFPYDDATLNSISHIQGYILFDSFGMKSFEEKLYNLLLLKELIEVYKDYINLKYKNNRNYLYSNLQQAIEGVAKYTEIKMAELAAKDYSPLNEDLDFKRIWDENYQKQINVVRHCGKGTGGRLTFYYLGCGKCLMLDRLYPKWKELYFETLWLDDIIDRVIVEVMKQLKSSNDTFGKNS